MRTSSDISPTNYVTRNILKEEYDEEYNHYEDELLVEKKSSKIIITGQVSSGAINLKIVEKDGDTEKKTYEYKFEDAINETIELEKSILLIGLLL